MPLGRSLRRRHERLRSEMERSVEDLFPRERDRKIDGLVGVGAELLTVHPSSPPVRLWYGNCRTPLGLCRCISAVPQDERDISDSDALLEIAVAQALQFKSVIKIFMK